MAAKKAITEAVWEEQVALFELGFKHGTDIAAELGVTPSSVSRQMRRRGAVKGSRANETVAELEAALKRKAHNAALVELSDSQRKRKVAEANIAAMGRMVVMLLEADRRGDLVMMAPVIARIGNAAGAGRKGRGKR